jgi:small subunit ribosomal protein S15
MHSRHRGKSKSRKSPAKSAPAWVHSTAKEVVSLILKLSKEGRKEPEIGVILRDSHGVPSVKQITGKSISQILKDEGASATYPTDLMQLITKAVRLRKHLKENKKDTLNTTALKNVESKIRRLVKYYRGKKLPVDWKYDSEKAALLVK